MNNNSRNNKNRSTINRNKRQLQQAKEKNENIQDYFRQELGKQCEISDKIVKNELSRNDELQVNEDKENVSFQKD